MSISPLIAKTHAYPVCRLFIWVPSAARKTAWAGCWLLGACLLLTALQAQATGWDEVPEPSTGVTRVIGETAAGCIQGAVALPAQGPGFETMHLERRRYFGHPLLIGNLESLAAAVQAHHWGTLHIGDLSQPRGGPMPGGHKSHQNGLDVDIWFALASGLTQGADFQRSNIHAPSLLTLNQRSLDQQLWSHLHAQLLKAAAQLLEVDRIFVHPRIKQALCQSYRHDRGWLRKIRPWYRHDDHLHLRMRCPDDSPSCESQSPVPEGDGCDASLDWWLVQPPLPPLSDKPLPRQGPLPLLPAACNALLHAENAASTREARSADPVRK